MSNHNGETEKASDWWSLFIGVQIGLILGMVL